MRKQPHRRRSQNDSNADRRTPASRQVTKLLEQVHDQQAWLADAELVLEAIISDEVDALVIRKGLAEKIYALTSIDELEDIKTDIQSARRRSGREKHHSRAELEALTAKLMVAQEEERRRIARDLHDDTNQRLALLMIEIDTLLGLPSSGRSIREPLQKVHAELVELSDHLRSLAHQLHPAILDDLGLAAAMRRFVEDFSKRTGIACKLAVGDLPDWLPREFSTGLYRILQECLTNVRKHAKATEVKVQCFRSGGKIMLTVQDNGVGIPSGTRETSEKGATSKTGQGSGQRAGLGR